MNDVQMTLKRYSEDRYNVDIEGLVVVDTCGFGCAGGDDCYKREPVSKTLMKMRVEKLNYSLTVGKGEVRVEMTKNEYELRAGSWVICHMILGCTTLFEDYSECSVV